MHNPRTNILLLAILAAAIGLVGLNPKMSRGVNDLGISRENTSSKASAHTAFEPLSGDVSAEVSTLVGKPTRIVVPALCVSHPLTADANELVTAMCDLQLLADGTGLVLESEQWSALAKVVLQLQAVRHEYEAQIATLTVIGRDRFRVEIPAYAVAGDLLRERLAVELQTELGETATHEVWTRIGRKLAGRFAEFGGNEQTLEITTDPAGSLADTQVVRTVQFRGEGMQGERVTTRREISFPVVEDATGDSWRALLAMVVEAGMENGPG
jgi:hypothetical protein